MDIKDALAINSNGEIIDSFEHDLDSEEYLVVDLFCLKGLLKNMRFFVLPYCAWLILATSLNLYIAIFN